MGVLVDRVEGNGVEHDRVVVGEGEGEEKSRAPRALPDRTRLVGE